MPSLRLISAAAVLLFSAASAFAADTPDKALAQVVAKGADLYAHATFGGNGRTCESCHVGGGKVAGQLPNGRAIPSLANAAAIFPRFSRGAGQVVTLEGQIRQCIKGGLGGTAPQGGSPDLVALSAYLGSIAHGQAVEIGGTPK